jgi:MFS family permease
MAVILLNSGTLAWFFLIQYNISAILANSSSNLLWGINDALLFYGFAAISAILSSLIKERICNRIFLLFWISLGIFSTILLPLFSYSIFFPFLTILMGISLGLGLPSSMTFIADCTVVEERARVSGTTIFLTFVMTIFVMMINGIFEFDLSLLILVIAFVRATSLLALLFDKFDGKNKEIDESGLSELDYKDFIYYVIPWLMFILIAMLAWNMIPHEDYISAVSTGQILRFICIAVFSLISGFAADSLGRKQSIIFGLIVFGISFTILGFSITELNIIVYLTGSGIAWGSFFSIYLAIPGDLSTSGQNKKFYALITVLPLILLGSVPFIPGLSDFTRYSVSYSHIFSFILLLSIIPVYRAKETLPDIKIREKRLKDYMEKVGKLVLESKQNK